jgi:yecA family protein
MARANQNDFKPPNLLALGALSFGESERARLSSWLGEPGWPRGHMDMPELEGYLAALISWPVGISAGAWLPPIWGVRGWKMPAPITTERHLEEFASLIAGFMQELDRLFSNASPDFGSCVLWRLPDKLQIEGLHSWGRGFMTALALGSQGLKWRSAGAGDAVRAIASSTSSAAKLHSQDREEVMRAVCSLAKLRSSRGPLGPLLPGIAVDSSTTAGGVRSKGGVRPRSSPGR